MFHFSNIFRCEYCQKTYGKKSGLKYHILLMHGPKDLQKFECKLCVNRFFTQSKLENHVLLRHSTEADKKFHCEKCEKKLDSHIRIQLSNY